MACVAPIRAWYARKVNSETGKRSVVFHPSEAYVDMPVQLPCGKCIQCKADQALMWSIRAYHESTLHDQSCFVTLTYDDDHYPPDGKIDKAELQRFFKRLRRDPLVPKLRYIACGEYGEQTRRAHYHAIIFGVDFLADKVQITDDLYTSPTLARHWQQGHVSIAPVSMSSICYVCGYVMKKLKDEDTFNLMSRRPGIGHDWLDRYSDDLRRTGTVTIEGREYPIPPRYLMWSPDDFEDVKKARKRYALELQAQVDPVTRAKRARSREINRKALISQKEETL